MLWTTRLRPCRLAGDTRVEIEQLLITGSAGRKHAGAGRGRRARHEPTDRRGRRRIANSLRRAGNNGLETPVPHVVLAVHLVTLQIADDERSLVDAIAAAERRIAHRLHRVLIIVAFDAGDD